MTIRLAKSEDITVAADVLVRAYNNINIGEKWTHETALQLLKHLYKIQPDLFFVAEVEGTIVGAIVAIVKPYWDGNRLTDGEFFVDYSFQKQGIGPRLLQHMFKVAKETYQAISWDTYTHRIHEHPLSWYKKIGFKEIDHWIMITGDLNTVLSNLD